MVRVNKEQEQLISEKQPHEMGYRWVMLILVSLLYCAFGVVQSALSPLVTPILKDLNISYSQMGTIMGAWPVTYIVVAAIGGAIMDRFGIRKTLLFGILIIGLSASLRYFANGFIAMLLFVALFGLGGPMISIGCPKTISEWFRGKERGAAVGVYMAGSALGGLISLSMTNSIVMPLTGYSWKLTFVSYGLVSFAAALLWWFLARDVKATRIGERTSIVEVFRGLIGVRNVQLILIMGFLSMVVSHGFTNWLPKILETGGLPPAVAGLAASIPVLIGIPTVLVIPRLIQPRLRGRTVALFSLAGAIVVMIVAMASGSLLITGLVLYGLCFRCAMPLLMLVLMDLPEVGAKYMGSAGGMYFCVAEIGGFAGPFMMGVIRDMTGGFLVGASLLAGATLVMSIMALLLKIEPAVEAKTSA